MGKEKKKYYINMASKEISQLKFGDNEDFVIYATEQEVHELRKKMNEMHNADSRSYWRAHVPIMMYHNDKSNDDYDKNITDAFQMIYQLGDEEAKEHIDSMGVLGDRHL